MRDLRNPAPPIVASETDGERNREGKEGLRGARTRSSATLTAAPLSTLHNAAWTARDAFAVAREKRSPRRPRRGTPCWLSQLYAIPQVGACTGRGDGADIIWSATHRNA